MTPREKNACLDSHPAPHVGREARVPAHIHFSFVPMHTLSPSPSVRSRLSPAPLQAPIMLCSPASLDLQVQMLPTHKEPQTQFVSSSHHQWWLNFTSSLLPFPSLWSLLPNMPGLGTVLMIYTFSSGLGRLSLIRLASTFEA